MSTNRGNRPKVTLVFEPIRFPRLNMPEGWLHDNAACHALWYYATLTKKNMAERFSTIQYEDEEREAGFHRDQRQLFTSVATLYGVSPEQMTKFWTNVDMQMRMMGGEPLPAGVRFETVPEVRTQ